MANRRRIKSMIATSEKLALYVDNEGYFIDETLYWDVSHDDMGFVFPKTCFTKEFSRRTGQTGDWLAQQGQPRFCQSNGLEAATVWKTSHAVYKYGETRTFLEGPLKPAFVFLTNVEAEEFVKSYPTEQSYYITLPFLFLSDEARKLFEGAVFWYVCMLPFSDDYLKRDGNMTRIAGLLQRRLDHGKEYSPAFLHNLSQAICDSGLDQQYIKYVHSGAESDPKRIKI